MRTYVLLSHRRPGLVLGKLDGVVGGQAAALSVEPRQQIGHSVAQTVPRLGLRAEARAGRHDPRHRRALLQHAADLERLAHEVADRLGLGHGRVDVELGVRLPEAGDLEEPLDEFGLVAQLRRCCHREHDPRGDLHRPFNWENGAPGPRKGPGGVRLGAGTAYLLNVFG